MAAAWNCLSARRYEKCCCFLTSHGTSYGGGACISVRNKWPADMIQRVPLVSGHPLERVEGCRHTDELMANLLVMVDSVWISMRASACRCSMTDKVWWTRWSWFSHQGRQRFHQSTSINLLFCFFGLIFLEKKGEVFYVSVSDERGEKISNLLLMLTSKCFLWISMTYEETGKGTFEDEQQQNVAFYWDVFLHKSSGLESCRG